MKEVITKVYQYDELSPEAQEKARDWWLGDGWEPAWTQETIDSMKKFADLFPIKLGHWSVGGRGEDVPFRFDYDPYNLEEMSGLRLAKYIWNNYRHDIWKGKYYSTGGRYDENGQYHYKKRYSKIILEVSCPFTGYCGDHYLLDPLLKFMNKPEPTTTFRDLLEECFGSWINGYNDDVDSQREEEYVAENIRINEYEFTADGERF